MNIPQFIYFPIDGHLVLFQCLAVMSNAAINILALAGVAQWIEHRPVN